MIHLRRHHPLLGRRGRIPCRPRCGHLTHFGQSRPPLGWVGLVAIAGVLFGYYAISRAKKKVDRKWRKIHWQVELGALVLATIHGISFLIRILGR